jgi:hypothetical protein
VFRSPLYRFLLISFTLLPFISFGQEIDYDSLLQRVDSVANPVFKPVFSISYGVLNFRGDVSNSLITPLTGNSGGMINVATFIDRKNRYFIANFNFLTGKLTASEYSYNDLSRNLNFETSLFAIGANVEYRFGHLIPEEFPIKPYLQVGLEIVNFSSKGDLTDASGSTYYYWSDGSIRDQSEAMGDGNLLYRDYVYETDLRKRESNEFGLGNYNQRSIGIPLGAGLNFRVGSRAAFSLGVTYHLTLTDFIDNVAFEGTSVQGEKGNDAFVYSYVSVHFDLFSDPKTQTVDLFYADVEFDDLFFGDEDGDFVLDVSDHCIGTPYGVVVDTLGCPLDGDLDGVPDYLDMELETASGVWVDDLGVTLTEEAFYASIESRNSAMPREDVEAYFETIRDDYALRRSNEIPGRFLPLDIDADGYISFEELLQAIDLYFDYQIDLGIEEVRELNDFFFSQ